MASNSMDNAKGESVASYSEDHYEELASQEQLYLDDVEENLRVILNSDRSYPLPDASHQFCKPEDLDGQSNQAAQEPVSRGSDHPQLSEELSMTIRMWLGVI
jgi:hypothetical protein